MGKPRRQHEGPDGAGGHCASGTTNVLAAIQVAQKLGPGATVVTLAIDSGLKYLSTDVYRS